MNNIFLIGGATFSFIFGSRLTAIEGIVDGKSSSRVSRPPTPPKTGLDSYWLWQLDYVVGVSNLGETLTLDKTILIYN
jgi:hypothetical protein